MKRSGATNTNWACNLLFYFRFEFEEIKKRAEAARFFVFTLLPFDFPFQISSSRKEDIATTATMLRFSEFYIWGKSAIVYLKTCNNIGRHECICDEEGLLGKKILRLDENWACAIYSYFFSSLFWDRVVRNWNRNCSCIH